MTAGLGDGSLTFKKATRMIVELGDVSSESHRLGWEGRGHVL